MRGYTYITVQVHDAELDLISAYAQLTSNGDGGEAMVDMQTIKDDGKSNLWDDLSIKTQRKIQDRIKNTEGVVDDILFHN
jgi:hypothetical protein